jgi:hypothetical protein
MTEVDDEPAPLVVDRDHQASRGEAPERYHGEQGEPVPFLVRRQATARHSQETGDQNDIGEELQEDDASREPADTRQLEKQNQESDEKKSQAESTLIVGRIYSKHDPKPQP